MTKKRKIEFGEIKWVSSPIFFVFLICVLKLKNRFINLPTSHYT
ncbi:hypothetical protein [Moraxella lacunata]